MSDVALGGPLGILRHAWPGFRDFGSLDAFAVDSRARTCEQVWIDEAFSTLITFFPSEHYVFLRDRLDAVDMGPGALGENIACEGVFESAVFCGDKLKIGDAVVEVVGPALSMRDGEVAGTLAEMIDVLVVNGRCGWQSRVVEEGLIEPGVMIELLSRDEDSISIKDAFMDNILRL